MNQMENGIEKPWGPLRKEDTPGLALFLSLIHIWGPPSWPPATFPPSKTTGTLSLIHIWIGLRQAIGADNG